MATDDASDLSTRPFFNRAPSSVLVAGFGFLPASASSISVHAAEESSDAQSDAAAAASASSAAISSAESDATASSSTSSSPPPLNARAETKTPREGPRTDDTMGIAPLHHADCDVAPTRPPARRTSVDASRSPDATAAASL